ncbi:MAG: DJ-1/PfpI family protein [Desulfobacteraceae bacterium]|jgi:4-methyl-5(b-hydroxyethyl)-thiazole monophosphate biosynthesis
MKNVLLLLAQGFEECEASVFTDVLGWSKDIGDIPVKVTTAGRRSQIKCTWNFIVTPEIQLPEISVNDYDALAIPGGFEKAGFYQDAYHEDFLNIIHQFNESKKIIASICVGALPLGKSGILKNKKATTYHLLGGKRRKQLQSFGANVQDQSIVVDDNIITSTSPATALDVAFILLRMLTSPDNEKIVKTAMGFLQEPGT